MQSSLEELLFLLWDKIEARGMLMPVHSSHCFDTPVYFLPSYARLG